MKVSIASQTFVIIIMAVSLSHCTDNPPENLKTYINNIKQTSCVTVEPLSSFAIYQPFHYTAIMVRSPFVPLEFDNQLENKSAISHNNNRKKEFLESFALERFTMVGYIAQSDIVWGLIKLDNDKIYYVTIGDYIGKHSGRIYNIAVDTIDITEIINDGNGKILKRRTSISKK